ncbi:DUF924 domain-containing protein [Aurantiacibacter xanthus]|uniref:DUF924 domain-containing protein n=1 Tax=Aurantiacibacter xanthus TaxID=1784712 RepID=A0A3A1PIJ7_9SPHN|nr:DUF924 family protein [Aurantiacibacter xanthus]RIV93451.1 DUF924 domain-containing protein [Aurantiacibacter xanthus]
MTISPLDPTRAADEVLGFWLGKVPADKRFAQDDAIDVTIAQRFGPLHTELAEGVPPAWRETAHTTLAAIVVLDQFSRNMFRDDPRAFAQDDAALALAREALVKGFDAGMTGEEKMFLYMPFMHSEQLADVERSITLMHAAELAEGEEFARRHAETIARFGRYPARNAALGRATTAEEYAFLAEHPMGF